MTCRRTATTLIIPSRRNTSRKLSPYMSVLTQTLWGSCGHRPCRFYTPSSCNSGTSGIYLRNVVATNGNSRSHIQINVAIFEKDEGENHTFFNLETEPIAYCLCILSNYRTSRYNSNITYILYFLCHIKILEFSILFAPTRILMYFF